MEIHFLNAKNSLFFASSQQLQKSYGATGATGAKKIALRLQALGSARSLDDMRQLPGRCHELTGDRSGTFAVDLHQGFRLLFAPNDPVPTKPDGGIDWTLVEAITILEVTDYHD